LIGLSCFSCFWKLRLCEVYICRDYNSWWNTLYYRFLFNAHAQPIGGEILSMSMYISFI